VARKQIRTLVLFYKEKNAVISKVYTGT